MSWLNQLRKKERHGSRPRCILFMDGDREEVAARLTKLVCLPDVKVSSNDKWMPYDKPVKKEDGSWDKTPAAEVQLDKRNYLVSSENKEHLWKWWLATQTITPSWDIASTCSINGEPGLILVEAKAHETELTDPDDCSSKNWKNRERIGKAISEANCNLRLKTKNPWNLSRCDHYQLSNRFAWSWKLASLGVPVVLVYLGFLNAKDMASGKTMLFYSQPEWEGILKSYCKDNIDNTCWEKHWDFIAPFTPVIRSYNQPFDPKNS